MKGKIYAGGLSYDWKERCDSRAYRLSVDEEEGFCWCEVPRSLNCEYFSILSLGSLQ